ncbi:Bug family tripartite tricarboxylate transporter substrate binding protein [Cupriavidus sp. SS-3]|uniref:Bug family tripartite tricarboxylate transporter substrate binding protein n=1 Tax=Cupriavidus sp. SS-3 TaxID=3109596 RepID=UPI002DBC5DA5|nr:tripartite tricarboxylate transporter substrate-binding protein [Cupriavidus sp. SS-3]MEC3767474.1 tripartite tricarboxylate transporter substrate-binding protein [Cupriavidus sp. SS-3]
MIRSITLATLLSLSAGVSLAQQNPTPVRLLVGFSAGGAIDSVGRALAESLRVTLKQPVIVENKPGANQRLALAELKRSPPDGQTLVLANSAPFTIFPHAFKKLEFDAVKDFTPVGRVTTYELCVAAGPKAPPGGIKEVLVWAKAHPSEASYGTSGPGNISHFLGGMIGTANGMQLQHVPYKGGAPALVDLAGGQIPMIIDTIYEPMEMSKSGKVRILATTGESRSPFLPNVPTLREAGINVAADAYVALYAPAGLPADKVKRLNKALEEAMRSHELQARIKQFAMSPAFSTPSELARLQATTAASWEGPIKASGFSAD